MTLLYRMRVLAEEWTRARSSFRVWQKPFGRGRGVGAVDADLMQIQLWEGAVLRGVEAVPQGTTHDSLGAEIGHGEKVWRRLWSKKLKEVEEAGVPAHAGKAR